MVSRLLVLLVLAAPFARPSCAQETGPSPVDALEPFVKDGSLAGAVVLVADKDRTLLTGAAGYADVAARVPLKTDALFWIASQSKPITAAALMILVDEGKVRLDDPVAKYLPEFKDVWVAAERDADHVLLKRPTRPVSVRHLLSHTSGLPFKSAMEEPTLDRLPLRDATRSYAMTPLLSEPGKKYAYSNAGINTAGRIIEVVSKMPYEEFLQKRLLGPLGMKDTTFWPTETQLARLAKAYRPGPDKKSLVETPVTQLTYPLSDRRDRHPMPAGGLFSTAADVAAFCRIMLNGGTADGKRILSEAAVKEMTTRQTPAEVKESYGLGWSVGDGTFGHGGAYATDMQVDARRGLVLVWMVQHAGFAGDGAKAKGEFTRAAVERIGRGK
jgi:CubicO group peptidase (beta-lactamase class C family)